MRRSTTCAAAVLLIAAACGGTSTAEPSTTSRAAATTAPTTTAPTTTTTIPPGTVFGSDDGRVVIEVPAAALPDGDPGITITALSPDEQPVELGDLDVKPWVYRLEPDHLEFGAPVTVTVTVPFDEFATEGFTDAVPLATLVTTTLDGSGWETLDDLAIGRDGDTVTISGTTDHFSRLAAIPEQVFIESRFVEIGTGPSFDVGFDFIWSNGVALAPPSVGTGSWTSADGGITIPAVAGAGGFSIECPPGIAGAPGRFHTGWALDPTTDTSGQVGLVITPTLTGSSEPTPVMVSAGLRLLCRPTIADGGEISLTIQVDHPGGATFVPDGDFKGGASAERVVLGGEFPDVVAGLVRDSNSNGQIDGTDTMYPPEPGTIVDGTTVFVLPLYGYGDYFNYFLDLPGVTTRPLDTSVTVADGATILLGGLLEPEQTAVPFLGDLPFIGRVFSDETETSERAELLIFITPQIIEGTE